MGMGPGYNTYSIPSPQAFADYLNSAGFVQPSKQPSMIADMVARANQATTNVPTLAQLFPSLSTINTQAPAVNYSYTPQITGMYGAGRFGGGILGPSFNFNAPKA
jgi:hypothetical protein